MNWFYYSLAIYVVSAIGCWKLFKYAYKKDPEEFEDAIINYTAVAWWASFIPLVNTFVAFSFLSDIWDNWITKYRVRRSLRKVRNSMHKRKEDPEVIKQLDELIDFTNKL